MKRKKSDKQTGVEPAERTQTGTELKKEPLNPEEAISAKAYSLYEKSGFINGNDRRDWLEAEKSILERK
jgi:hypothetical protein